MSWVDELSGWIERKEDTIFEVENGLYNSHDKTKSESSFYNNKYVCINSPGPEIRKTRLLRSEEQDKGNVYGQGTNIPGDF